MEGELTIVTLMAGRFHTLEPYLHGLHNLDYPKEKIHLLWATNSKKEMYLELAKMQMDKIKGEYASVKFLEVPLNESENAFVESGTGTAEHADVIANMYNVAYKYIPTDYFLCIEDDVGAPSNAVERLLKPYDDEKVGYTCGVQFDRHRKKAGVFTWNLKRVRRAKKELVFEDYIPTVVSNEWGVQEIGASHLGLTMLRKSILDTLPKPIFQQRTPLSTTLVGCDLVLCLHLMQAGYKRVIDFNVRAAHYDSRGKIH